MDASARRRRALAVPCRSSGPGGWRTPRGRGELRRQHADGRQLRRLPPGPHRAGPSAPHGPTEEELCLTCHGAASTGATTDVMTGVQYRVGTNGLRGGHPAGRPAERRLRPGQDRVRATSTGSRRRTAAIRTKVPVISGPAERHLRPHRAPGERTALPGIAWGNGAISATPNAGPAHQLSCGSCHNPHGNGQYRILNPIPGDGRRAAGRGHGRQHRHRRGASARR